MTCPVCSKPVDPTETKSAPFCSDRCRKVDFVRWWDGRYAIVEDLSNNPAALDKLASEFEDFPDDVDG
ncbi:MAG: DNA gyrase inhibitor YacG [Planctomycetaceae bacterium]